MFPRFIWLGCLASSSEWNFICFCCVPVGWKEAVLVLWATCKHSVWSPDWSCALAFWKGRVCPLPFGRVTLLFPCFDIDITTVVQSDQHLQFIHNKPSCFCLGNQILAPPHLKYPETPDLSLGKLLDSLCLYQWLLFFPLSPVKVRYWGEKSFACLLPDACIFPEWTGERTDLGDWVLGLCLV